MPAELDMLSVGKRHANNEIFMRIESGKVIIGEINLNAEKWPNFGFN